jgi:hypothetical protein
LGIVAVSDVPGLSARRAALLPLARDLASAPPEALRKFEDSASRFNVGWSVGREALQSDVKDAFKQSFYANPLHDNPAGHNAELQTLYPSASSVQASC